jgi:transformation/transcription domain-associated protein
MNLPLVVQTASVRLLLNMVDPVYHNKEEKASLGRDILFRILETLVWKLGMLVDHGIRNVKEAEERSKGLLAGTHRNKDGESIHAGEKGGSAASKEEIHEFMYGAKSAESPGTVQNIRELIKPLLPGIKTLVWCINNYGTQREKITSSKDKNNDSKSKANDDHASRQRLWYEELAVQNINVSERALIGKYFVWTLEVLKVFKEDPTSTESIIELDDTKLSTNEYEGVLENFASSLSVLDPFTFQRVVGPQMGLLIDSIIDDEAILIVPKTFLQQNLNISSDFAACLIHALMEDVDALDIGVAESDDKKVLHSADMKMTLFSMIFSSLSVSPKNEKVLRPHLQQLIAVCLRRAMGSDMKFWPGNHFTILRQLFRAIAGGKFEESYKEILPLLPTLLNGLYRVYCNTDHDTLKKVIIELCLTIPARLSSLLPHLSLLLRIIVPALQTNDGDLINLG